MSEMKWILTNDRDKKYVLPEQMSFIGSEDCEVIIESDEIDKQHAMLRYDMTRGSFRIKDLGSKKGTFLNNICLPCQVYITLKDGDSLRFGSDPSEFTIEKKITKLTNRLVMSNSYEKKYASSDSSTSDGLSSSFRDGTSKLSGSVSKATSSTPSKSAFLEHSTARTLKIEESATGTISRLKSSNSTPPSVSGKSVTCFSGSKLEFESKQQNDEEDKGASFINGGPRTSPNIQERIKKLNLPLENSVKRSQDEEVEDWFCVNAPSKIASIATELNTGKQLQLDSAARPGTPLATLDQIPSTHSPHYLPKPDSRISEFHKTRDQGDQSDEKEGEIVGDCDSTTMNKSLVTYTLDSKSKHRASETNKENAFLGEIHSIWVSEWVEQHQKTPGHVAIPRGEMPPSYEECTPEHVEGASNLKHNIRTPSIGSLDEHGKRTRRSLPQVPTPEKHWHSTSERMSQSDQEKKCASVQSGSSDKKEKQLSDSRSPEENISKKILMESSPKKTNNGMSETVNRDESEYRQLSRNSSASLLSVSNSKLQQHKAEQIQAPQHQFETAIHERNYDASVKNTEHSTVTPKTSASRNSERKSIISRSDSFTKDEPSGVVPFDQIPVIEAEVHAISEGKCSEEIEKRRADASIFGTESSSSCLGTSELLMDTNAMMSSKKTMKTKKTTLKQKQLLPTDSGNSTDTDFEISSNVSLSNGESSCNKKSPRKVLEERAKNKNKFTVGQPASTSAPTELRKSEMKKGHQEVFDNQAKCNRSSIKLKKSMETTLCDSDVRESLPKRERAKLSSAADLRHTTMSSRLKLNRATLLRKNMAKKTSRSTTRAVSTSSTGDGNFRRMQGGRSTEKLLHTKQANKLHTSTMQGLSEPLKPLVRCIAQMREKSQLEISETNFKNFYTSRSEEAEDHKRKFVASTEDSTDRSEGVTVSPLLPSPTTPNTDLSLGTKIVELAQNNLGNSIDQSSEWEYESVRMRNKQQVDRRREKNVTRSISLDRNIYQDARIAKLSSHHLGSFNSSFSYNMSELDSGDRIFLSPLQMKMLEKRELPTPSATTFDSKIHEVADSCESRELNGDISQEVALVSQNLVRDLEILSKSMDEVDLTVARDKLSSTMSWPQRHRNSNFLPTDSLDSFLSVESDCSGLPDYLVTSKPHETYYSLEHTISNQPTTLSNRIPCYQRAIALDSPSKSRRTWGVGSESLDSLALSNALSLSNKLNTMAVRIQSKVKLSLKKSCGEECHCQECEETASESKFSSNSSDVPLLQQTSTQEMASLINNMRHLECLLKVIEWHVEFGHPSHERR